ncbi:MAG: protein-(glutamine-N5) methyltransferase, release factor-specific [Paludibacter sp.]|nr:MAG: protein-(glutamine-N5) methyltransferase, release factor-specific [Paludibacter sp.]
MIEKSRTIETEKIKILDIGTGSGCIAVSLAKHIPNAELYAMDKFSKVLDIAKKNAEDNNVRIETICADILETIQLETSFDIIVSNPPYIPLSEKTQMDKKVTNNEPDSALFVPNSTPILFYEKIAEFSLKHLKDKGLLFYEIHQNFGNEVKEILKEKGFQNIKLKKDISKNDRMICAEKY